MSTEGYSSINQPVSTSRTPLLQGLQPSGESLLTTNKKIAYIAASAFSGLLIFGKVDVYLVGKFLSYLGKIGKVALVMTPHSWLVIAAGIALFLLSTAILLYIQRNASNRDHWKYIALAVVILPVVPLAVLVLWVLSYCNCSFVGCGSSDRRTARQ